MIYSIIIPHKNTPELLKRCIDSIPCREDTEIIIVDDCSDSSIVNFDNFPCNERKDVRIFLNNKPIGAGPARNLGIKEARGEWIIFSDSDDYFTTKLPIIMDKYAEKGNVDMVIWNAKSINEYGVVGSLSLNLYIKNYFRNREYSLSTLKYHFWAPWSRMIKKKILIDNNIEFENVPFGNDKKGILTASIAAKVVAVEKDFVYIYWKPTYGSQTHLKHNTKSKDQILLIINQTLYVNRLYKEVNYPFLWPITIPKGISRDDPKLIQLLQEYNYSSLQNIFNKIKYIIAKLLKLI